MPHRRNNDGTTTPLAPMGWQGGLDIEVSREGDQHRWCIYDEDVLVATGTAHTRFGLAFAVRRAHRKASAQVGR